MLRTLNVRHYYSKSPVYTRLGAVHRYYESRRRIGIEELPDRQEKAAEQKKRRKYRARQQRVRLRCYYTIILSCYCIGL